jgi:hypothetical protein
MSFTTCRGTFYFCSACGLFGNSIIGAKFIEPAPKLKIACARARAKIEQPDQLKNRPFGTGSNYVNSIGINSEIREEPENRMVFWTTSLTLTVTGFNLNVKNGHQFS